MKHLILSFKSRNELYGFAKILKSNSIFISIINSPKNIGSSCTLSIKADYRFLLPIQKLLYKFQPNSFLGLFSISSGLSGDQILRLM